MKKNKNKKRDEFLANQETFLVIFLAAALLVLSLSLLYGRYKELDFLAASVLSRSVSAIDFDAIDNSSGLAESSEGMKAMNDYERCIRDNFSSIAPSDSVGASIDNVSFVSSNRALIFYHDNEKNLISEVVMGHGEDGAPRIEKKYLKNSNGHDYSQGVYGADPG